MSSLRTLLFLPICTLLVLPPAAAAAAVIDSVPGTPGTAMLLGTRAVDTNGTVHRIGFENGLRATALVFLETGCVVSRRGLGELNRIAAEALALDAELYGVLSSPLMTLAEARDFVTEYGIDFPVLFDSNGDLAERLDPRVVPEAFVVDPADQLVYRGRIDDRFVSPGKIRANAERRDLYEGLRAAAQGAAVTIGETKPVGCVFETWSDEPKDVTYHRNVEPLLRKHCRDCHQEDSVAPFALDTYRDARRRARMIHSVVADGFMPPWQTKAGHGLFRNTNRLSDREISVLADWIEAGAPEGSAEERLPVAPDAASDSDLTPDIVAKMPEPFAVPADGEDIYRYFVLPRNELLDRDQVVRAIGFRAGAKSVVHHADFFVDYSGRARAADEADPEPGFSVFGTGGFLSYFDSGFLGAWGPDGGGVWVLPNDTGIPVPKGGDLVMEIHYHPTGKAAVDQSELMLYFAKEPVSRHVATIFPGTQDIDIPAGDDHYVRRFWMELPDDTDLYSIAPHMHFIGKTVSVDAHLPGGTVRPLLYLDDWDFRWQGAYEFPSPVRLPAGTRIDATFVFDNSADNPDNPLSPPQPMDWGWATDQEMAELYILSSTVDPTKMPALQTAGLVSWYRDADPRRAEPIAGLESAEDALAALQDRSLWSVESQRVLNQIGARPWFAGLGKLLESRIESAPDRAQALADLGTFVLTHSYFQIDQQRGTELAYEADALYDRALEIDPENWDALYGKATSYRYADPSYGLGDSALELFQRAIRVHDKRSIPQELRRKAERGLAAIESGASESAAQTDAPSGLLEQLLEGSVWSAEGQRALESLVARGGWEALKSELRARLEDDRRGARLHSLLGSMIATEMTEDQSWDEQTRLWNESERHLDRALRIDKEDWDARMSRAALYLSYPEQDYVATARHDLERLLEIQAERQPQPHFALTHYYLGQALWIQGHRKKAVAAWQDGIESHPGSTVLEDALAQARATLR